MPAYFKLKRVKVFGSLVKVRVDNIANKNDISNFEVLKYYISSADSS